MWQVRKQQGQGPSGGQWFCFDDNTVEPWDIAKLDAECFGGKESESRAAQGLPPSPRPLGVSVAHHVVSIPRQPSPEERFRRPLPFPRPLGLSLAPMLKARRPWS